MWFSYTASDPGGRTVSGLIDAADMSDAQHQLASRGLRPLQIIAPPTPPGQEITRPVGVQQPDQPLPPAVSYTSFQPQAIAQVNVQASQSRAEPMSADDFVLQHFVYPVWTGVSLPEQALMYKQLGAMYDAGLSAHLSLSAVAQGTKSTGLLRALMGMQQQLLKGVPLSAAMAKYPGFFPPYHVAVVAAGEATGVMRPMLNRLAESLELEYQWRWELWKEVFTKGAFIMGNFIAMPMLILFLSHQFWLMILVFFLLLAPFAMIGLTYLASRLLKQVKEIYDFFMARTPGVAGIAQALSISRFCNALGTLYEAGVTIPTAVDYAAAACGNYSLAQQYRKAIAPLRRGASLVVAFQQSAAFPSLMLSMMPVAQETGNLKTLMDKIARHYELDAKTRLGTLCMNVGLVITIVSGIVAFFLVLYTYSGYLRGDFNTGV